MTLQSKNSSNLREQVEKYFTNWKWFLLSLLICFSLTFLYLRYATDTFKISATIKIADSNEQNISKQSNQLNDYGLFKRDQNSVLDEVQVIGSRSIINSVIEELGLNIQCYIQGSIKELEIYKNPPLTVNFLENDSILKTIDTSVTLNIISKSQFTFKNSDQKLNFGENISMPFGNIIFTPNFDQPELKVGKSVTVKFASEEKVASHYSDKIKITTTAVNSSIINITLDEPVKEKGIDILNELVAQYNKVVIENKNAVVKATSDFIDNRLAIVSRELSEVNQSSETAQQNNRLTDLSSQSSIFLQTEREIENQQIATSTELQVIDYVSKHISEKNGNGDLIPESMSFQDNSITSLMQKHNELVMERNKRLENSSEQNPVVKRLDAQIANLKQNFSASLNNLKSTNQIKLDNLNREENRISAQIFSAPKKQRILGDLQRQQSIKESVYVYLLQRREESAVSHGVSSPNAIIIDNAYASALPIWPKKSILFLGTFVLGLLIPLLTIYLMDLLDNKIRNKAGLIKELSIPFIGDVPKSNTKQIFIDRHDYSPKAESFRLIRTNIDFMLSNVTKSKGKTIFVTSTTSKEGKSHTSLNLARSLSFSNKKVLIIETDIRVPKLNKYMGVENKTGLGLTNYIIDNKINFTDVINNVDENLDMISSGTIPPNPAELLMDEKLDVLFNAVKNKYDYIIVDTAAVGLVTDTLLISKYADMVIYVVRANYLDKRQLHVAQSMYDEKRLPNMVTLLNGVIHKRGYGYGYGESPKKKRKLFS
ncbi:polysaccharide biosynthesis tyrosine autokinase [Pontimicrobium sp. SW4]|uniref:non-specific protein-tyrosine kinase n=1 Tax=Pontimicrobium sp. SW4 TaxID=3153519 RepID=A0AAU7BVV7_9FLAO